MLVALALIVAPYVRWPGNVIEELTEVTPGRVHVVPQTREPIPTLQVQLPKEVFAGEPMKIKLKMKGKNRKRWTITADVDGDGTYEPLPKKGLLTCTLEPPLSEVRLRLSHTEQGLHLERVLKIPVKLRPPPK